MTFPYIEAVAIQTNFELIYEQNHVAYKSCC